MTKKAFTLAEVLITLGIIGVVAAITMPNLIANYQKQQTVIHLKKIYSVLNQALQRSIIDNGNITTWSDAGGYSSGSGDPGLKYLIPYLEVADKFSRLEKWHEARADSSKGYMIWGSDGENVSQFNQGLALSPDAYVLKDGTIISFTNFLDYSPLYNALYILVDLNGFKGPNRIGRDVFLFTLSKDKPDTITTPRNNYTVDELIADQNSCPARGKSSGYLGYIGMGCSTIIMKDGWKIEKHYPWW